MTPTDAHTQRTAALEHLAWARLQHAATHHAYQTALRQAATAGATYAEIAATLGISRQAARTAVQRT